MPTIGAIYEGVIRDSDFAKRNEIAIREILCHIQGFPEMSDFYTKNREEIADLQLFRAYLARFLNGEPVQYILNRNRFMGIDLYVDSRVLIPRMETEEVVSYAIEKIKNIYSQKYISVADIGTGSGAIAIAIRKSFPSFNVYATDISRDALEVAKINDSHLKTNIKFLLGDHLEPLILKGVKIDVLISNPPYITNQKEIDASVLTYEPFNALVDIEETAVYKNIFRTYKAICNYPFLMVFEIGHDMAASLSKLIPIYMPKAEWHIIKDVNNKDRILSIYIEKE